MFNGSNVIGGEGCAWSEFLHPLNNHAKLYPNMATVAENLWSELEDIEDPYSNEYLYPRLQEMHKRLDRTNWYLDNIGIGLRHRSFYESVIKKSAMGEDYIPVMVVANLLRPASRVGAAMFNAESPLNFLIDYLYPESITTRKFGEILREIFIERVPRRQERLEDVKEYLNDWINAAQKLEKMLVKKDPPILKDEGNFPLLFFAPVLKDLAKCASQSLSKIEENTWKVDPKCSVKSHHYCGYYHQSVFLGVCDMLSRIIHNDVQLEFVPSECKVTRTHDSVNSTEIPS